MKDTLGNRSTVFQGSHFLNWRTKNESGSIDTRPNAITEVKGSNGTCPQLTFHKQCTGCSESSML
jgi:hypothetical protein